MTNFFPSRPAAHPTIYAYEDTHPQYRGLLKVGYTSVDVQHRVAQQYPTVDNATLRRLMGNAEAMAALTRIEGFRNLNQDIETIINKSEAVKKARKETPDEAMTPQKKRELTEEEKEYKSLRKQIQEKLIKFATRVPIFMYLTDFRERSLYDVITQLEPGLFKKVTGLSISDFELLVSLDVFNSALMNDAIYKFKRYEDASLTYVGINRHANKAIGLYNTVI